MSSRKTVRSSPVEDTVALPASSSSGLRAFDLEADPLPTGDGSDGYMRHGYQDYRVQLNTSLSLPPFDDKTGYSGNLRGTTKPDPETVVDSTPIQRRKKGNVSFAPVEMRRTIASEDGKMAVGSVTADSPPIRRLHPLPILGEASRGQPTVVFTPNTKLARISPREKQKQSTLAETDEFENSMREITLVIPCVDCFIEVYPACPDTGETCASCWRSSS